MRTNTSATAPPSTIAASAPSTAAALPAGARRDLPITTSVETLVDTSRPTVSHGRTIAASRTLEIAIVRPDGGGPYPLVVFAHGFQLGPGVGAVLAELVVDGASATPIDAFTIARFADGSASEAEHLRREFDAALLARTVGTTHGQPTGAAR